MDLNLNNLTCRVCLENFDTSNSLYDFVEYEEKVELKDILKRVTNVEVANNEEVIPTRICSNCTERLLNAYELVCQVEKSEVVLQSYIKKENKGLLANDSTLLQQQEDAIRSDGEEMVENEEFEILEDEFQILPDDGQESFTYEINHVESENEIEAEELKLQPEGKYGENKNFNCNNSTGQKNEINEENNATNKKNNSSPSTQIESKEGILGNINSTHQCDLCHRKFAKSDTLKRHIKVAHTYAPPEKIAAVVALIPNPPKEQFTCMYCPRTFARKDNLKRHLQVVHHVKIMQEITTKKQHTYKRGLCPYCGESFSQASLIVHIRRHTGETPYKCTDCNKGFPRRQDLTIHQRKHTGERPHVCTVCGKTFSRPNKLTRHMRIHTGERPYKCTECDRSFAQSNDLNIHLRRHTGEKPYKCSVCGDAFISGTALKSHRKLKSHDAEENELSVDPFEKIRVNNRRRTVVEKAIHRKTDPSDEVIIEFIDDL